jgi:hypothetical protein
MALQSLVRTHESKNKRNASSEKNSKKCSPHNKEERSKQVPGKIPGETLLTLFVFVVRGTKKKKCYRAGSLSACLPKACQGPERPCRAGNMFLFFFSLSPPFFFLFTPSFFFFSLFSPSCPFLFLTLPFVCGRGGGGGGGGGRGGGEC